MLPEIDANSHQKHYSEEVTSTTIEISRDVYIQDKTSVGNIRDNAVDVIEDDFQYTNDDFMTTEDITRDNDAISNAVKEYDDAELYNNLETDFNKIEAEKRVINNANNFKASRIEKGKADFRYQPSLDHQNFKAENEFEFSRSNVKNVIDSQMILDGKYLDLFTEITSGSGKVTWQCKTCHKTLTSRHSLKRHALIHTDMRLYKCIQCEYKTNHTQDLDSHIAKHTGNYIKCEFCVFIANSRKSLQKHVKLIHIRGQPKCEFCDYQVHKKVNMEFHRKLHGLKDTIKCDFCDYLCLKKKNLNSHVQRAHEKKQNIMLQQ